MASLSRPGARGGLAFLAAFGFVAVGVGAGRAITTTYVPVLLERIKDAPGLIGAVMLVNAASGFLVPIAVGIWSDRRGARGRLAFITGGTLVTVGGLLAVALGTESSYLALGLAALAVYVGLNATATAHRAIVAESFEDGRRPAATSAQEVAMLGGGLLGVLAGGALIDGSAWLLFVAGAAALPLFALPTLASTRRYLRGRPAAAAANGVDAPKARLSDLREAMGRRGPREVLVAQILWVTGYAALPAFFILYADEVLGLGAGTASIGLAAFGLLTGAGMLAAGRTKPEKVYPRLLLGAALLGGGLVTAALGGSVAAVALPFAAAAVGMGLVTALGFPYFARFIPQGGSGRYSGLYFSVRAIASAVALPVAGIAIELSGSYRSLLVLGAASLAALVPLARAGAHEARAAAAPAAAARPLRRVAAVIPWHGDERFHEVALATLQHVDELVLVDDGSPAAVASSVDRLSGVERVRVLRLPVNSGKGDALAAGANLLFDGPDPPDAIVVVDADGQHPPERIPDFVAAGAHAHVVIGDRSADRRSMPLVRRATNSVSSGLLGLVTRRRLADSQCGMRLYRADALERAPFPPGRYEAETLHLKAALRERLALSWVPIPAIYDGAVSHFRPVRDTWRVLRSIVGRGPRPEAERVHRPSREFARKWSLRLSLVSGATIAFGAVMPLIGPLDERLFLALHSLGDGPPWLYEALDPHTRNYVLLALAATVVAAFSSRRLALVVAVAVTFSGLFSDLLVQLVYLVYDRPRPEEILAGQFIPTPGHNWAEIASFPSGHLVVTTALAVTAMSLVPALRGPLWIYVGLIALTRIVFGAHFPMDVLMGGVFGYVAGRFAAELPYAMGALRGSPASALPFHGHVHMPARRLRTADR